jgi:hypothetical protein
MKVRILGIGLAKTGSMVEARPCYIASYGAGSCCPS